MSNPVRRALYTLLPLLMIALGLAGCPTKPTNRLPTNCGKTGQACCNENACDSPAFCVQDVCVGPKADAGPDAGVDAGPCSYDSSNLTGWCSKSGSWVYDTCGAHVIGTDPGLGPTAAGSWLHLPEGYCAHHYATVPNARQIRFAPNGDLFVSSPTQDSTGGGAGGLNAIVVVPDDNQDGYGDSVLHFRDGLVATQGMLFANGYFYYQFPDDPKTCTQTSNCVSGDTCVDGLCEAGDGEVQQTATVDCGNDSEPVSAAIVREPYTSGQRATSSSQTQEIEILTYCSGLHWPKTLDMSDDGTIFVGNGGDQTEVCEQPMPTHGGIWKMDGTADGTNVVMGMRNPYVIRCHQGTNNCFSTELSLDYSTGQGGREKLIQIYSGENVGFPCCATANLPYPTYPNSNCSNVVSELDSFVIGDTPFGLAFIDAQFPAPWDHTVFVSQHGAAGTWTGARVVGITLDPTTGIPEPGSDVSGSDTGAMTDFATGWDDTSVTGHFTHGRPADMEVSSDGRLFISSDTSGEIFWIAPVTTSN